MDYNISWVVDEEVGLKYFTCDCGEELDVESINIEDGIECPHCNTRYKLRMGISIEKEMEE